VQEREEGKDSGQGHNAETYEDQMMGTHFEVKVLMSDQEVDIGSLPCYTAVGRSSLLGEVVNSMRKGSHEGGQQIKLTTCECSVD